MFHAEPRIGLRSVYPVNTPTPIIFTFPKTKTIPNPLKIMTTRKNMTYVDSSSDSDVSYAPPAKRRLDLAKVTRVPKSYVEISTVEKFLEFRKFWNFWNRNFLAPNPIFIF